MGILAGDSLPKRRVASGPTKPKPRVAAYKPVRKITAPKKDPTATFARKLAAKPVQPVAAKPKPRITDFDGIARRASVETGEFANYDSRYPGGAPPASGSGSGASPTPAPSAADVKADEDEKAATDAAIAEADEALDLQLKAIEAQFGMTRAQLEADEGEAGRQYRAAKVGLIRQRDMNLEANLNSMVERGIIRSGITLQNEADVREQYAEGTGTALGDRDFKYAQIAAQKAALDPQEAYEKSRATRDHEQAILSLSQMEALANGGL